MRHIALLVNQPRVLGRVPVDGIEPIKNRVPGGKLLSTEGTQPPLFLPLLIFQRAASHWFASLVVGELFVDLAPVRKKQILVSSAQGFELASDFLEKHSGSFELLRIKISIRHGVTSSPINEFTRGNRRRSRLLNVTPGGVI